MDMNDDTRRRMVNDFYFFCQETTARGYHDDGHAVFEYQELVK